MFLPLMAQLRVGRDTGRPRTRPDAVRGDKAYSSRAIRSHLPTLPPLRELVHAGTILPPEFGKARGQLGLVASHSSTPVHAG